jgi:hypothetical protein
VLSVLLRYKDSDYTSGIFKLFKYSKKQSNAIKNLFLNLTLTYVINYNIAYRVFAMVHRNVKYWDVFHRNLQTSDTNPCVLNAISSPVMLQSCWVIIIVTL